MLARSAGWLGLSVFLIILLGVGLPAESQAPLKKPAKTADPPKPNLQILEKPKKEWAVVDGFRSAKFGMSEKQVLRAIAKDFKISKRKVDRKFLPTEKITALMIHTPKLMNVGGPADIVYFLGYESKKLMQVNIDWGKGVTENINGDDILSAANLLRNHLTKKKYKKEGYAVNTRFDDNRMLVFRGKDKKDRMITLKLTKSKTKEGKNKKTEGKNMSLVLSYILDVKKPDIYQGKKK